jgi:(p)ppGpp synthase/HD superfamily hydrolase
MAQCEAFARMAHQGQFRKFGADKGKPYIVHPERMAKTCAKDSNFLVVCAAWLHDVIEDTDYIPDDLLKIPEMDPIVVDIVKLLTRREGQDYLDYLLKIKSDCVAKRVKLADIEDNLKSCPHKNLRDKYLLARYILELPNWDG